MARVGCCGSTIRVLLIIINSLFFVVGLTVIILTAVLRWGSFLTKLIDDPNIHTLVNVSSIKWVTVTFFVLGGFMVLLSLIGLIGSCCISKVLLFVYEAIIVALFLAHGVFLIVGKWFLILKYIFFFIEISLFSLCHDFHISVWILKKFLISHYFILCKRSFYNFKNQIHKIVFD